MEATTTSAATRAAHTQEAPPHPSEEGTGLMRRQHPMSRRTSPVKAGVLGLSAVVFGVLVTLFSLVVNLVFWLALIFGTLWGLDHFGVLDKL